MRHMILALSAGLLVVIITLQIWHSPRSSMVTAGGSASFAPRPLQLVIPSPPPLQPGPITAAAAPRLPTMPDPRPLAAVAPPEAAIPPSMILAPPANFAPSLPPMHNLAAEEAPAVRVPSSPPPARNLAAAEAPAAPAGDHIWVETPSTQERPEIRVTSRTGAPGALIVTSADFHRNWHWAQSGLVAYEAIEPGEYTYQLLGPHARERGSPDQEGVLRCRRYHLYELFIDWSHRADPNTPLQKDLGD